MGFHINNDSSDTNPFGSCRWASRIHSPGLRGLSARSTRAAGCFCSWLDFLEETYLVETAPPRWKGLRAAELSSLGGQPTAQGISGAGEGMGGTGEWEPAERAWLGWDEGILLWVEAGEQDRVKARFVEALKAAFITQKAVWSFFVYDYHGLSYVSQFNISFPVGSKFALQIESFFSEC